VAGLVEHGELANDWHLGARIERHLASQVERGRAWDAVRLGAAHAELALLRDAPATAARALGIAREQAARLRSPAAADELLGRTEAAIAAHHAAETGQALPDAPGALLEQLRAQEDRDPERELELLEAGRRRWPDAVELVETLASAQAVLGRPDAAAATTRAFAEEHPGDAEAWTLHGFAVIAAGDEDAVEEVAARLEDLSPADAAWIRARWAAERGDDEATIRHAARVVALDPDAQNARRLLARAAVHAGDHATALTHYDVLVDGAPAEEAEDEHWERLVPATVLGAWDKVRASAAAVGLEPKPGEGPIDEEWHTLVLRFDARDLAWAIRTGPVSARVIEVAPSTRAQHAGDRVVFDPAPVDEPEDEGGPHTFQVVETLEPGELFTCDVDGVHPGQERWEAFRDTLRDEGWLVGALFVDGYVLQDDDVERPGLFGALALPRGLAAADGHARLTELTADWPHPFTWLALAEASGDADAAARQRADAARLELY
jgi:hypothetical protein